MRRLIFTGTSAASAAAVHNLTVPTDTSFIDIHSLVISTYGADISSDVKVDINNGQWITYLRSGKEYSKTS